MARIRSIKPEFWTDGKTRRLSDGSALFFIALWNHCDDAGFFPTDSLELSMKVARWRSQDVKRMLSALHRAGMVRLSEGHGVGMITSWHHQKIDKPRSSKWKDKEIQWDAIPDSSNVLESSSNVRRKDRIGEDRIGEDSIKRERSAKSRTKAARAPSLTAPVPVGKTLGSFYIDCYRNRYHGDPGLMPKDFKLLKNIGEAFGLERARELIQGYFKMNTRWFITKLHDVPTLNGNLNAVQTFITTGTIVTDADARNAEVGSALENQIRRLGEAAL